MSVLSLQDKLFECDREKVHHELVHYFVKLDEQQKLWYFIHAIRVHSNGRYFSINQAEQLIGKIADHCDIKKIDIQMAKLYDPFARVSYKWQQKVVPIQRNAVSGDLFEEQMSMLYHLIQKKTLEYRPGLELVLILLERYPSAIRTLA
ncbi:hypothetical protein [Desulfogranum japonicum]|uniref:hypothetical protein n=1 Tax=Desulfogranum japonicum TaxID=231447 RepID=UPI0004087406|nr:hypothetical protein [Desulfogranum japonicum]